MSVNLYRKSGIHSRVVLDGQIHENTPFVAPFIHEIRSNHILSLRSIYSYPSAP